MATSETAVSAEALIHGMIACRANAHELIVDADLLAENRRHPRAYALLHTACEELGKFAILEIGARGLFGGRPPKWKRFWQRFRSHDSKSAQFEAQLLMLALLSGDTDRFSGLAESLFSRGLQVRNAALYVDLGPDGNFRNPSDIDFAIPMPGLRALTAHALAAADQRGQTPAEIEVHLKAAPTDDTLKTANALVARVLERGRDAGITRERMHELIEKWLK